MKLLRAIWRALFPPPPPTPVSENDRAEATVRLLAIKSIADKHIDMRTSAAGGWSARHASVPMEDLLRIWDLADQAYWNLK